MVHLDDCSQLSAVDSMPRMVIKLPHSLVGSTSAAIILVADVQRRVIIMLGKVWSLLARRFFSQ